MRWDGVRSELAYAAAGSAGSAGFGLISVELIQVGPQALPVLALVGLGLLVGYRMYVRERRERLALEFLHQSSDALSSPDLETAQLQLLRGVRGMFNAELAQLTIFPSLPAEKAFRTTVRIDHPDQTMEPLAMTQLDDVLEAESDGVIVDRWRSSPAAAEMLARRGVSVAMVALLRGQTRILGSLVVGGHLDPRGFDDGDLRLFRALAVQTSASLESGRLERSISRLTELQEQLAHQSFHDSLTNLPNRSLFADRIEHALMRGARAGRSVAVLFVDVDDFRAVNDTYGHTCGDALLVGLADRLRTALRRPDTAARLGGDEFAVLLEDLDDAAGPRSSRGGSSRRCARPTRSMDRRSPHASPSVSRSRTAPATTRATSCATPMLRSTPRKERARTAASSSLRAWRTTSSAATGCAVSWSRRSSPTSSSCTTSPSSTWSPGSSSAWRRSCAGVIRRGGWSAPVNSCPWPKRAG